jgi:hypothetical protein
MNEAAASKLALIVVEDILVGRMTVYETKQAKQRTRTQMSDWAFDSTRKGMTGRKQMLANAVVRYEMRRKGKEGKS